MTREITINIVTNNNQYGLSNDASLLVSNLSLAAKTTKSFSFKVRPVNFYCSECGNADINFFLELPNPLLIHSAKINILIANPEWFFKTWIPYLTEFDQIWCKTKCAESLFTKLINENFKINQDKVPKIIYTGWTSLDRNSLKEKASYSDFIHVAGKSILKGSQRLVESWKPDYPKLHLIANSENNSITLSPDKDNIVIYKEMLSDATLISLMNKCGVHICPSEAEGFGHYLNEARSCGAVVVTTDANPMNQFSVRPFLIKVDESKPMERTLGTQQFFNQEHFSEIISTLITTDTTELKKVGAQSRLDFIKDQKKFREQLSNCMVNLVDKLDKNNIKTKIPMEIKQNIETLPSITIVTLTRNRPNFFGLAKLNYQGTDYPEHLLEWVIVDDSDPDKRVHDLIPKEIDSVKYITLDKPTTIAEKRNIAVKNSKNEVIMMMDDDDIYPPRHALVKISYLQHYGAKCGYCTSIGCFHIKKLISTINVPPIEIAPEARVSEATMCFHRSFWEERNFRDSDKGSEAAYFIKDRYEQCITYPWRSVLVSLLHSSNISSRVKNLGDEPNGCHFGLSDDLFKFITSLE